MTDLNILYPTFRDIGPGETIELADDYVGRYEKQKGEAHYWVTHIHMSGDTFTYCCKADGDPIHA